MYIRSSLDLKAFCEHARACGSVAIDTEFLREKTYFPKLCLIQAATATQQVVIDPLLIDDLSDFSVLMENKRVVKIFHACSQDIEVLFDALECTPKPMFDTQVAAAFLGYRYQLGYGALVEALAHVRLPKNQALTDWSQRPLSSQQLSYALDDVRYLPDIYSRMHKELIERERMAWFQQEMTDVVEKARAHQNPYDAYLHVRRISNLTRSQLAIAKEVAYLRDNIAREKDIPRRWVFADDILIEICRIAPTSLRQLMRIRNLEALSDTELESILSAVAKGVACPPDKCPESIRKPHPTQDLEGVLDLMYALMRMLADKHDLASQLIATRDDLFDLVKNPEQSKLSHDWRYELVGRELSQLLRGEIGLTVKNNNIEKL